MIRIHNWRTRHRLRRRLRAQQMARRSNEVQAAKRLTRDPDADTVMRRALHDARGTVIREGCTFTARGETHWQVRRSLRGRTNQFDLVANGRVVKTCGRRALPLRFRPSCTPNP